MRLLLDTNTVLWWIGRSPRLGLSAAQLVAAGENDVFVSPISIFEIGTKRALGKLQAPPDLEEQVNLHGFASLPLTSRHASVAGDLPLHHKDPFDRLLLAQARCEGLTFVTSDRELGAYGVPILDAAI